MLRIISCFILLIFIIAKGMSLAETFKCTRPDGSVFFTNDPSQVPSGCVVEKITEDPSIGTAPDTTLQPQTPSAGDQILTQKKSEAIRTFASFEIEAENLIERFQSARHSVVRSSFVTEQLKARRELVDIKKQKESLLREIDQSSLKSPEKEQLNRLLSQINE